MQTKFDRRFRFLASVCHVCKEKTSQYTCSVCRMVFYCSPAHRRENWYDHSRLCWAFSKICHENNVEHLMEAWNGEDFTGFRHKIAGKCLQLLGRSLTAWELDIIYHPRICDVCGESAWENLKPCKNCSVVYTCTERHFRPDHSKWCKILKTYSDIIVNDGQSNSDQCEIPEKEVNLKKSRRMTMSKVVDDLLESNNQVLGITDLNVMKSHLSDLLTYPLTVFDSLRQIRAENRSNISILFVGAEIQAEVEPVVKWEKFLLHQLPATDSLNLIFLGPELRVKNSKYTGFLCDSCRCQKKRLTCEFVDGKFYHEYSPRAKDSNLDLICAFNSGMYRDFSFAGRDHWNETILDLFTRQTTPVVVTEYTACEMKKDLEKLEKLCGKLKFVTSPRQNPFASLKPELNLISQNEIPVIFKNYYSILIKPKSD